MRAMTCHFLSRNREGLRFEADWPEPSPPEACEVTVAISHAALNYPDLLMLSGDYQFAPPLPFIPGVEGAGTVIAAGSSVDPAMVGRDVIIGARCGLLAERITVPATSVRLRPAPLDPASAASFTVTALTAYVALARRGRLAPGERVIVTGAGGGTGLAAVAMAKALGATVVAAASSVAKVEAATAAGADEAILVARGASFPTVEMADVIFDPVGGSPAVTLLNALRRGGRYLIIGFVGGIPSLPFDGIADGGIDIVGVRAGEFARRDPAGGLDNIAAIDHLAEELRPFIGLRLPLADTADAFSAMVEGVLVGKAVIDCA